MTKKNTHLNLIKKIKFLKFKRKCLFVNKLKVLENTKEFSLLLFFHIYPILLQILDHPLFNLWISNQSEDKYIEGSNILQWQWISWFFRVWCHKSERIIK